MTAETSLMKEIAKVFFAMSKTLSELQGNGFFYGRFRAKKKKVPINSHG